MASPKSSLATLRPDLAESLVEFDMAADRAGFIGHSVLPVLNVATQSGVFGKLKMEDLLSERNSRRASGAGYARSDFQFSTGSYATQEFGVEEVIDDREVALYANYLDAELISAQRAYDAVLRSAEKRIADAIFNPTTFASQKTTVTNEWNDAANATPLVDVEAAVNAVYDRTGLWANTLIINMKVFRALRNCASIIDRINSAGAGNPSKASDVTVAMLEQVFALDKIMVAGSSRNAAKEGQDASPVQLWNSEYAMVAHISESADLRKPTLGRTFHWSADGSTIGGTVETYREEAIRGDVVRVRHEVEEKLLYPELGQLLDNITA